jgi:hypothetical protein
MSELSAEIEALEAKVAEATSDLEAALGALSDAYWGIEATADAPLFECLKSTAELLDEIELSIDCKILEIRAAS